MLLLDSKATVIRRGRRLNVHLLNTFKSLLNPGSVYSVSGFDVTRSIINFKLLASPIFVRFSESTTFKEITAPVRPIP
ncbi:hypothetical protein Bca101_067144 [Brassica carinata]